MKLCWLWQRLPAICDVITRNTPTLCTTRELTTFFLICCWIFLLLRNRQVSIMLKQNRNFSSEQRHTRFIFRSYSFFENGKHLSSGILHPRIYIQINQDKKKIDSTSPKRIRTIQNSPTCVGLNETNFRQTLAPVHRFKELHKILSLVRFISI